MKRCIAAVLLVLSLEALAAGRLSAAVADDHVDTIRLPSNGLADEVATAATEIGAEKKRPWKCCDSPLCSRSIPPRCRCMDAVEQCDEACNRCEASQSDPSKHVCIDRYHGWPGPNCTKPDVNGDISSGVAGRGEATATEKKATAGERPWECCNVALCTRSWPPMCRCVDQVEQCAAACKSCEPATSDSSRLVCNDWYHGFPGPKCMQLGAAKPDEDVNVNGQVSSELAGHHEAAAEMAVSEEINVVDGEEKPRPWKCCDQTLCTRSAPPTCFCHDKVKKCAKTCKNCLKDESDSSLHMCGDPYFGWPGPKCHKI